MSSELRWSSITQGVFVKPQETFHTLIQTNSDYHIAKLAMIAGTIDLLFDFEKFGDSWPVIFLAGPVKGLVIVYILSRILFCTGQLFGGTGKVKDIQAAYAWTITPFMVLSGILMLLGHFLFGHNATLDYIANFFLFVTGIILCIWSFYVYLIALAEPHRFTKRRALCTTLLPLLILMAVLFMLSMGFTALVHLSAK
jgi:hypothetical protein